MSKLHWSGNRWLFECPGCGCMHFIDERWNFNGDTELPTITPSILVTGTRLITDDEASRIMAGEKIELPKTRCHSFVTGGKIRFLDDCTHELKGLMVDLPEVAGDHITGCLMRTH